jgi:hypothetical protein
MVRVRGLDVPYESVIFTSVEYASQRLVGMDGPSLGRKDAFRNQTPPGVHRIGVVDLEDRDLGPAGPGAPPGPSVDRFLPNLRGEPRSRGRSLLQVPVSHGFRG